MARSFRVVRWILLVLLIASSVAAGRQLRVSKDELGAYRSVQAAMRDAQAGDTIRVEPGVYEEQVDFVNGVTVIGSGAERTLIRYGYGFDEVLRAVNTASGRIVGVTLERMPSMLEAPVVVLDSAALTFQDCVISGGQGEGVRVGGISARAELVNCDVIGNRLHGISCETGGTVVVSGGSVSGNGGAGLRVIDGELQIDRTRIEDNDVSGIATEKTARLTASGIVVRGHSGWGVEAHDGATVELIEVQLDDNGGGVQLSGSSTARIVASTVTGGGTGVVAVGASRLEMSATAIQGTEGDGVRLDGSATAHLTRVEIIHCGGSGAVLDGTGRSTLEHVTVVGNAEDGVAAAGGPVTVTDSIVALNGGGGLRTASDSPSTPHAFGHNVVWGNGHDYVGTVRRSTDRATYPEFVDPAAGDLGLRLDSPCIGAGSWGATVGAHPDPRRAATAQAELAIHGAAPFGFRVAGSALLSGRPPYVDELLCRIERADEIASIAIASRCLGSATPRLRADGSLRWLHLELPGHDASSARVDARLGALGVLDGAASRFIVRAAAAWETEGYGLSGEFSWEHPTGIRHQTLDLRLGPLSVALGSTQRTLDALEAELAGVLRPASGTLSASAGVTLLPDRLASFHADWQSSRWSMGLSARSYLQQLGTGEISLWWFDDARHARIGVDGAFVDGSLSDVAVRASTGLADATVEAAVGVNSAHGVRFRIAVEIDTHRWWVEPPNEPPVPAFTHSPFEPETGEPVLFDATAASDPDGRVTETWWDFGDGVVEVGNPIEHRFDRPGDYAVSLTVGDENGATATLVTTVTVHEAQTTPVASFTWAPVTEAGTVLTRPLRAGDRVRLDASSSYDPDGTITEFGWDLESDGTFDLTVTQPAVTLDPFSAGTWPVTLRIVDGSGKADAVMRVLRVEKPKPPQARFALSPELPSIYDPIRFVDRSIATDGQLVAWDWSFGDGHTSRQREPVHRYDEDGRYPVRLTVTDSIGLHDTWVETIEVQRLPGVVPVASVWAVVIGISDYHDVEDLPYAHRDAQAVTRWLLNQEVAPERIRLLTDDPSDLRDRTGLSVEPPTLINVREALGWLRRSAGEDDLVLIHFSGHGYQGPDDGTDEADLVDEFFVLQDTKAVAKEDTALRDDEFGRFLDRIASNHVLVFFDSCYAGGLSRSLPPGRRSTGEEGDWFGDLRLEGRLVLAAASEGEEAYESPELEHGVFTHFLLRGLRGEADLNKDYHVTVWELYEYVAAEVPPFVAAERDRPQHPQMLGEGESRIILSVRDRPVEAGFSYAPAIPFAGGTVVFADETEGGGERSWSFGDGATAVGPRVEHRFDEPGRYEVVLVVASVEGQALSEAQLEVDVAPPGRVVALDTTSDRVIISLGEVHGIRLGARFAVIPLDEDPDATPTAVLEVVELVDGHRAACRIVEGDAPDDTGRRVRPLEAAIPKID